MEQAPPFGMSSGRLLPQGRKKENGQYIMKKGLRLTLKPSMIEADDSEAIDLESFRADLHKMVDEIYAEA